MVADVYGHRRLAFRCLLLVIEYRAFPRVAKKQDHEYEFQPFFGDEQADLKYQAAFSTAKT